jgi:hypothetical protein
MRCGWGTTTSGPSTCCWIGTEHLLLGVLEYERANGGGALTELGITQRRASQWLGAELQRLVEGKRKAGEA